MRKLLLCAALLSVCLCAACGNKPVETAPTPTPELDVESFLRGENAGLIEVLGDGQQ
ncbi:MAG: hypothetical protein IJN25_08075 [Clostridia bacterium]|nr:hypothetical protein [Clostridia bacterium]